MKTLENTCALYSHVICCTWQRLLGSGVLLTGIFCTVRQRVVKMHIITALQSERVCPPAFYTSVVQSQRTKPPPGLLQRTDLTVLFTYEQSQSRVQIPRSKQQCVYLWKAVYVGQCVRGLKGWEIMSTKGAPGALDWVSLLPLSLFHPPLPFFFGHFQHYPGTFKRLDHCFYNCATNACQQLAMKETNGEYYFLISKYTSQLWDYTLYLYLIM